MDELKLLAEKNSGQDLRKSLFPEKIKKGKGGKEIIKEIMLYRGWSQSKLAEALGKNQTNITGYLNRGKNEMRLDVFVEMAEAMDCEVVVIDKTNEENKWTVKFGKG